MVIIYGEGRGVTVCGKVYRVRSDMFKVMCQTLCYTFFLSLYNKNKVVDQFLKNKEPIESWNPINNETWICYTVWIQIAGYTFSFWVWTLLCRIMEEVSLR